MSLALYLSARGPARPNPPLESLPGVARVVDAASLRGPVPGVGEPDGRGGMVTYHVTDDPAGVLRLLARRADVVASYGPKGRHAELGPGLYLSDFPRFWSGRSSRKWAFLDDLGPSRLGALLDALDAEVRKLEGDRYIAHWEADRALATLGRVRAGVLPPSILTEIASQPFNVPFWRAKFLGPLGIAASPEPGLVEVTLAGRFAELQSSHPPHALLRTLRRAGLQGAYTPAGMATNPELVLWDPRAVLFAREVAW